MKFKKMGLIGPAGTSRVKIIYEQILPAIVVTNMMKNIQRRNSIFNIIDISI